MFVHCWLTQNWHFGGRQRKEGKGERVFSLISSHMDIMGSENLHYQHQMVLPKVQSVCAASTSLLEVAVPVEWAVPELNCVVSPLSSFHHVPLHMKLHIRNYPTQDTLWFYDSIRPTLHMPWDVYPECTSVSECAALWTNRAAGSPSLNLETIRQNRLTQESCSQSIWKYSCPSVTNQGLSKANSWAQDGKKRSFPTAPCSNEREEVLKVEKSHI